MSDLLGVLRLDGSLLVRLPASHCLDPELGGATSLPLERALAKCYDLR